MEGALFFETSGSLYHAVYACRKMVAHSVALVRTSTAQYSVVLCRVAVVSGLGTDKHFAVDCNTRDSLSLGVKYCYTKNF